MKTAAPTAPAKTSIQVIERMNALLDALAQYPDPVSLKELSKVSGLHPSTAHRILNDMVVTRFVDRVEPGTYRLGMRLLELGNVVKSRLSVREAALDFMRNLHKKTQQTINLSVRQGDEIVYIDRAFSERSGMQASCSCRSTSPRPFAPTPRALAWPGTTRIRLRIWASSSENCRWCARVAMHATTKSWSWGYAAWRPASMTIPASSLPACRSRRRPTACRKSGWKT
jgi:hypothetical protein